MKVYNKKTGIFEPLDSDKVYMLDGTSFMLRNQGVGFSIFAKSRLIKDYIGEDYLVLSAFAKAFSKNTADGLQKLNLT